MFNILKKTTINKEQAKEILKEKGAKLVDVRESNEYTSYKIKNSTNYPLSKLQNLENINNIIPDKSAPLILFCASGGRSKLATKLLKHQGYEKVYDLGSINNWL